MEFDTLSMGLSDKEMQVEGKEGDSRKGGPRYRNKALAKSQKQIDK